jgi:hypothetical protein
MIKIIIGCDPDVDGKGFSIYHDSNLVELRQFSLLNLYFYIDYLQSNIKLNNNIELHIEDLCANKSSAFGHKSRQPKQVQNKISESVGRCKQIQLEVEKIATHFDIKIVRHKVSSKWKDAAGRKEFERVTGWKGQSNPDTRSAAYFGYLGTLK